jgi:tRNA pseudouridine55 synthase
MKKDGILVVDKPAGISSYKVVERVKHLLRAAKVGHTGTLDPFATGVLPICINQATKAAQFFLEDDKEYCAGMLLGVETDTQDLTGKVVSRHQTALPDRQAVCQSAGSFVGLIEQRPPAYSAIKVDGRRLYKAARKGQAVRIPARIITINYLKVLAVEGPHVTFHVRCSKGTYIRSLAADWGKNLGCGAHLIELRRIRSGPFSLDHAVSLDDLEQEASRGGQIGKIVDLAQALSHWPELRVDEQTARSVLQGRQFRDAERIATLHLKINDKIRLIGEEGNLIGIMRPVFDTQMEHVLELRSMRIFNPPSN